MTMNLKGIFKTTRAAIGALVFVFAGAAQAQIPVTDVASISTSVANQVESMAKWAQQFNQLQQQINDLKRDKENLFNQLDQKRIESKDQVSKRGLLSKLFG